MLKLTRTKKIIIASTVAIGVILAIALPVSLNKSKRNENESGSDGDTVNAFSGYFPSCPCFTIHDLNNAMNDIIGNRGFTFDEDASCTGKTVTAINYSDGDTAMGYSVGEGFCASSDAVFDDITMEEETTCRALIDSLCFKYNDDLDLDYTPQFSCPCFDEDMIDKAVADITGDARYTFTSDNSCKAGEVETGFKYNYLEDGTDPVTMGFGISDGQCESDEIEIIEVGEEIACRALVEAKCDEFKDEI